MDGKIREFLAVPGRGYGSSNGSGSGRGSGSGDGRGYGDGSGRGSGDGRGYGYGYGDGDGCGYGCGYGSGSGSYIGSGNGCGYGDGCGSGDGRGIISVNGAPVYDVDGVATIIRVVHGNVAKGAILHRDMSTTPCYIVKQGGVYAHGRTLRKAQTALMDKLLEGMPLEDRIAAFVEEHQLGQEYPNRDYFSWHHRLTGSCEAGRLAFARDHQVDLDGSMTVEEFIALTEHAYGGEVIRKLRETYGADDGRFLSRKKRECVTGGIRNGSEC